MAERTENQIRAAVDLVTPSSESWKVDIFTIPDEVSLRPVNLQSAVDARRKVLDWGIVGTVVAMVSILAALGSWIQVARRPVPTPGPVLQTRHYHVDTASEPGPSERVRELVRRIPKPPPASFSAGQGREAAPDDDDSTRCSLATDRRHHRLSTMRRPTSGRSRRAELAAVGDQDAAASAISPVRKAAIVLVSLDQSLASQFLSHLDRPAVEAVTWEIARLERVDPADRAAVLEEFYGLGLRTALLRF